jgi:hypothetical protein
LEARSRPAADNSPRENKSAQPDTRPRHTRELGPGNKSARPGTRPRPTGGNWAPGTQIFTTRHETTPCWRAAGHAKSTAGDWTGTCLKQLAAGEQITAGDRTATCWGGRLGPGEPNQHSRGRRRRDLPGGVAIGPCENKSARPETGRRRAGGQLAAGAQVNTIKRQDRNLPTATSPDNIIGAAEGKTATWRRQLPRKQINADETGPRPAGGGGPRENNQRSRTKDHKMPRATGPRGSSQPDARPRSAGGTSRRPGRVNLYIRRQDRDQLGATGPRKNRSTVPDTGPRPAGRNRAPIKKFYTAGDTTATLRGHLAPGSESTHPETTPRPAGSN